MTRSAEIAAFELLKRGGVTAQQLAESRVTAEEARDAIFFMTGVRIPAGLIEQEMRRAMRGGARRETVQDAASDFQRDSLGQYHARQTGKTGPRTTELYRLIAQRG
jgi:hypothetical protein